MQVFCAYSILFHMQNLWYNGCVEELMTCCQAHLFLVREEVVAMTKYEKISLMISIVSLAIQFIDLVKQTMKKPNG